MEKEKVTKILVVISTVLLIMIVGTASFAYFGSFNVNLNNNVAVNVNSSSPGDAIFTSNTTQLNLQVPAANMSQTVANNSVVAASNTATLSVSLTGAENLLTTCTYDIVYEYDSESNVYGTSPTTKNGDKEITLQVYSGGTNNFASETNFDSDTISSFKNGNVYTLASGVTIISAGKQVVQNINITGKYYNLEVSQSSLEGKAFTGKIYATNHSCETSNLDLGTYGYERILAYNGGATLIESKGTPNFNTIATSSEGMYAATDDLGTSYYFRGAVDNNWVKFGKDSNGNDIYWRIIRINGDGSIRMIYSGTTAPTSSTAVVMTGTGTEIGTVEIANYLIENPATAGYMYTSGEQHGTNNSSPIKTEIDNWYETTTLNTDSATKSLIADQIFCNDRSITDGTWPVSGKIYFSAYTRLGTNKSPILTCPTVSDKFTVSESNGNGALDYPAGLITADEIAMAGGMWYTDNTLYYLNTDRFYLPGTPFNHPNGGYIIYDHSGVPYNGFPLRPLNFDNYQYGIRPVISLSSTAKLSGSGTYDDVYTVNES